MRGAAVARSQLERVVRKEREAKLQLQEARARQAVLALQADRAGAAAEQAEKEKADLLAKLHGCVHACWRVCMRKRGLREDACACIRCTHVNNP